MTAGARKFKVVVQKPSGSTSYDLADSAYSIEREALDPIGAEVVEVPAKTEEEFIAAARDADAVIVRNRRITETIIKRLRSCALERRSVASRTRPFRPRVAGLSSVRRLERAVRQPSLAADRSCRMKNATKGLVDSVV